MPGKSVVPALKIGLFGVGLEAYWKQFERLEERLRGYVDQVANRLGTFGAEIINLGLIDNPEKAFEAGSLFRREDVDIKFLYVTTVCALFNSAACNKKGESPCCCVKSCTRISN